MKKLFSFLCIILLCTIHISPVFAASGDALATSTGTTLSTEPTLTDSPALSLFPGKIITLTGNNLGTITPSDIQLCLTLNTCTVPGDFKKFITSWTDTAITFEIPDVAFGTDGTLYLHIPSSQTLITGPTFQFERIVPTFTSISTSSITPLETRITIIGTGFGATMSPNTKICLGLSGADMCLSPDGVKASNVSWSNTAISFIVPYFPKEQTGTIVLYVFRYKSVSGQTIFGRIVSPTVTFERPNDPEIFSITPLTVTPGNTIIALEGKGFGNALDITQNQICFQKGCIEASKMLSYIKKWSDTEILFSAPTFFNYEDSINLTLRLYFPSRQGFSTMKVPTTLQINHSPIISTYYPTIENGKDYSITGRYFGSDIGSIVIGSTEASIISWKDSAITFTAPEIPSQTTTMTIKAKNGTQSDSIEIMTLFAKKFSRDYLSSAQWYFDSLHVPDAWKVTEGSSDITVAVLDSGFDMSHEDLANALWTNIKEIPNNGIDDDNNGYIDDVHGWNTVQNNGDIRPINNHGTLVSSIIAATKDNGIGIAGIAPKVKIMPILVTEKANESIKEDHIEYDAVLKAVQYAVKNGARIINMSFGADAPAGFYTNIMQYAYDHNVLLVVSAGNNGVNLNTSNTSPVCDDGNKNFVLGIAALEHDLTRASFSNYGDRCVDLSVPGVDIVGASLMSNTIGDQLPYSKSAGTSFSAPIVAGGAALLISQHPDWNVEEVKQAMLNSVDQLTSGSGLGKGMLNFKTLLSSTKPNVTYNGNPSANLILEEKDMIIKVKDPTLTPINSSTPIQNTPANTGSAPATSTTTSPFSDVSSIHKNAPAITYLKSKGIIQGYADGTFQPNKSVNRAEFLKMLFESQGTNVPAQPTPCFTDIHNEWFAKYVCYAKAKGMIEGYKQKNGTYIFKPDQTINKAEATKMLIALFNIPTSSSFISSFQDVGQSAWFTKYVTAAEQLNLLEEKGSSSFLPATAMERASISEMLYRLLSMKERGLSHFE